MRNYLIVSCIFFRFDRIIKAVDTLLTVVKESLPGDRGDNPIVSNLVQNLYIQEMVAPRKVIN